MVFLWLSVGCSSTRTYEVSVSNNTEGPITIGLTKEGSPFQPEWASPEDAAIAGQPPVNTMWAAIPAGKTADTGAVKGKFASGSHAVLRVYQGKLNLQGILAVSRGQPNRMDIPLHPGLNRFTITDEGPRLMASREEAGQSMPVEQ